MVHIRFKKLHIEQIQDSSAVFSGENLQHNFLSIVSKNEGGGQFIGDNNTIIDNHYTVHDHTDTTKPR